MRDSERIDEALQVILLYGDIDGDHHKQWVIDQVVGMLTGSKKAYKKWVDAYCSDGENPKAYECDPGIAP